MILWPDEEWRDIPGYEGLYQVNRTGEVRNKKSQLLKHRNNDRGYPHVWLSKNGKLKAIAVHRVVASAFVANPEDFPEVNHINGVKTDNRAENLEWCTISYNRKHSSYILNNESGKPKRPVICLDTGVMYPSVAEAARAVSGFKQNITRCCQGKRNTTQGLRWAYAEEVGP